MILRHDTLPALAAAAALVNTEGRATEHLPDVAALHDLVRTWDWAGQHSCTETDLQAVRQLRPRLRQLWQARDEDEVVQIINRLLRTAHALPQLIRHDGWHYHLHATPSNGKLATRLAVGAAMAVAGLIQDQQLSRLRFCAYTGCDNVVIDLSKNRSKQYCEDGCGNRAAVAAYRARKAARG
jgi:predicted RNA-binding Zn ribbon-like protein